MNEFFAEYPELDISLNYKAQSASDMQAELASDMQAELIDSRIKIACL